MFKFSRYRQTCGLKEEMKNGKHKALINDDRKEKTQIQTTGPFCQRDDQAEIGA